MDSASEPLLDEQPQDSAAPEPGLVRAPTNGYLDRGADEVEEQRLKRNATAALWINICNCFEQGMSFFGWIGCLVRFSLTLL